MNKGLLKASHHYIILLAMIALLAVQSCTPTRIHINILFIDISTMLSTTVHIVSLGTPCFTIIASNVTADC